MAEAVLGSVSQRLLLESPVPVVAGRLRQDSEATS
jgi:nucleotide-binding universal stress UspA family protein